MRSIQSIQSTQSMPKVDAIDVINVIHPTGTVDYLHRRVPWQQRRDAAEGAIHPLGHAAAQEDVVVGGRVGHAAGGKPRVEAVPWMRPVFDPRPWGTHRTPPLKSNSDCSWYSHSTYGPNGIQKIETLQNHHDPPPPPPPPLPPRAAALPNQSQAGHTTIPSTWSRPATPKSAKERSRSSVKSATQPASGAKRARPERNRAPTSST